MHRKSFKPPGNEYPKIGEMNSIHMTRELPVVPVRDETIHTLPLQGGGMNRAAIRKKKPMKKVWKSEASKVSSADDTDNPETSW